MRCAPLIARWLVLATSLVVAVAHATPIPPLAARSLEGTPVALPAALPEGPVLLVVGFTRASRAQTEAWSRRLARADAVPTGVAVYQVAVIGDVPALFRGAVAKGIRQGVPTGLHARFLLVEEGIEDWKRLARVDAADAACLVLLDARRRVVWRHAGPVGDTAWAELTAALARLSGPPG